jgi:hypothetical protein
MMTTKSKMLFVLIGDDRTGKTSLQKLLIDKICKEDHYDRLYTNKIFDIVHPEIKRKYKSISFANRSYQEKLHDYKTVDNYFQNFFKQADIAFISSHLIENDIRLMIENGQKLFYNLTGVFWTNSIQNNHTGNSQISLLNWNERLVIDNQVTNNEEQMENQLNAIADDIVIFLMNRISIS